jgi:hypothetical protein
MKSAIFTVEIKVERRNWIRRGHESHGYCEEQGSYQMLVKRWKLLGVTICKKILDTEEIPGHVLIEVGALGRTVWKSKFAQYF